MIAKKMLQRQDVIRVCMESNTIAPGDRFTDVVNDDLLRKVDGAKLTGILCFGPVNENEMLFCAEDGRYYFSFRNGWGVKDNTLGSIQNSV